MGWLLWLWGLTSFLDEVAIQSELADQRIDLPQTQWRLCLPLQVAAHKTVVVDFHLERHGASLLEPRDAVLLVQGQQSLNATHRVLSLLVVHGLTKGADVMAELLGARQQLHGAGWRALRPVLLVNPMPATLLAQVLAQ